MVSPNDSWKDIEDGYESSSGSVKIYVESEVVRKNEGARQAETVQDPEDGNVWAVIVTYSTSHWIVTRFEEQRTAWEFANLLTHLFSELAPRAAKGVIMDTGASGEGTTLPTVVEERRDAESVLRKAMAHEDHHLDRVLEESE